MSSIVFHSLTPSNVTHMTASTRTHPAPAAPAPAPNEDSVQISAAAQAEVLHLAGDSVASIAVSLGASEMTIDGYLGITASVTVPVAAPHAAHAAPAAQAAPASAPELHKAFASG